MPSGALEEDEAFAAYADALVELDDDTATFQGIMRLADDNGIEVVFCVRAQAMGPAAQIAASRAATAWRRSRQTGAFPMEPTVRVDPSVQLCVIEEVVATRRAYTPIEEYALLSEHERVVLLSCRVLSQYGKNPTTKHIKEDLAGRLRVIADLTEESSIEQCLNGLVAKGYLDTITVPATISDPTLDVSRPYRSGQGERGAA